MKGQWDKVNAGSRSMRGRVNRKLTFENRDQERDVEASSISLDTSLIEVFRWSRRLMILIIRS